MSEMVERVAKAMWEGSGTASVPHAWFLLHPDKKSDYRNLARAAINAMREPTKEMADAGRLRWHEASYPYRATLHLGESGGAVWERMIDAALAPNPPVEFPG